MPHDHSTVLDLVNDLAADGARSFSFDEVRKRLARSPAATANCLRRAMANGLLDRVRRGRYMIRELGMLGTRAVAEDLCAVVATVFSDRPHRIAYGTALEEHDLVARPSQTICVATTKRMRVKSLSGRPLRTVLEPARAIPVGAVARGGSFVSDIERALLDAAARPELTGGATTLVEATVAAAGRVDPERLTRYARELGWAAALRRIGSIVDALEIHALARKLAPLRPPVAYLDLEPGLRGPPVWRDPRWRVCWQRPREELALATPRAGG